MKARFVLGALVTIVMLGACGQRESSSAQPEETKRTRTLAPILGTDQAHPIEGQYIVQLSSFHKETQVSAQSVGRLVAHLGLDPKGVQIKQVYSHAMNGFTAKLSAQNVQKLRMNKAVKYLAKDGVAKVAEVKASGSQDAAPWGLDRIDQKDLPLDQAYNYEQTGKGVDLFILDTGVRYSHQEFGGRARWGVNTTGDGIDKDCHEGGHGTIVSGIAAGKTYGVAKEANIIAVKTMKCDGRGDFSDIIKGIDWVIQNKKGPAVLNMSISSVAYKALDDAVNKAISKGVVTVVASGNNGKKDQPYDACLNTPARVKNAITVAATTSSDRYAWFANSGQCVDINAPGNRIESSGHNSDTEVVPESSGTSVASPFVAGAAALLLEKNPNMTPAQVESALRNNAVKGKLTQVPENNHPNALLNIDAKKEDNPPPGGVPPIVNFSTSVNGLTVQFTDMSSDLDGEDTIQSYYWEFGDGTTSTEKNPTKTYTSGGTYQVSLTVTDNTNLKSTESKSVVVKQQSGGIYEGIVNPNSSSFEPNGTQGFDYGGGVLKASLKSNAAAEFDLYLQKKIDGQWVDVDFSISEGNDESLTYVADAGSYRWEIYAYYGYGEYTLTEEK